MADLIDREKALGCFEGWDDGNGWIDETELPAYDRLQALPIVAEVEDCISRAAALDAVEHYFEGLPIRARLYVVDAIKALPSAQPIIHCKDCIHIHDNDCPISWGRQDFDYCSWAERRTDE